MKFLLLFFLFSSTCYGSLLNQFKKDYTNQPQKFEQLKKNTLELKGKAIGTLLSVIKSSDYPDKNRWAAMFLIGRIMGSKSKPLLVKYLEHPNWVLRLSSLKTLLSLSANEYGQEYAGLLKDKSLLVRSQALDNILHFKLNKFAPHVWKMLFDSQNYYQSKTKGNVRGHIIKEVVKAVGDLKYENAKSSLLKLAVADKYSDIFPEIEYSLEKITGQKSPHGSISKRRTFWRSYSRD
ncbi:MAG: hypothetical protein ACO20H_13090 [Bacteriovoracaceae bacterium]